jgi:hypothetical protein
MGEGDLVGTLGFVHEDTEHLCYISWGTGDVRIVVNGRNLHQWERGVAGEEGKCHEVIE